MLENTLAHCLPEPSELASQVAGGPIPHHVAIVMDGNRRWAMRHGLPIEAGYAAGVKALMRTVRAAADSGIRVLTVYGFSTENWGRSDEEVAQLIGRIQLAIERHTDEMIALGIRFRTIGDLSRFPSNVVQALQETVARTAGGTAIDLVVALNYGGRDDICRGIRRLIADRDNGKVSDKELTESLFSRYLDTAHWPDPQLLIRTSGEMRVSNFLLWQMSYSEIMVTDVLWPDFGPEELTSAITTYQRRESRRGV